MQRTLTHPIRIAAILFAFAVSLTMVVAIGTPADAAWTKNCTKVNKRHPSGIGKVTAVDVTAGTPVTTFTRSNKLFKKVKKLDTDRDRIACERTAALGSTAGPCPFPADAVDATRTAVLTHTNQYRASFGLRPLQLTVALDQLAQDWSASMAGNGFAGTLGHRPNFWTFYPAGWLTAGENVGQNSGGGTAQEIVTAWINSAPHRENLLSDSNCLGLGHASSGNGNQYWTQNFARY